MVTPEVSVPRRVNNRHPSKSETAQKGRFVVAGAGFAPSIAAAVDNRREILHRFLHVEQAMPVTSRHSGTAWRRMSSSRGLSARADSTSTGRPRTSSNSSLRSPTCSSRRVRSQRGSRCRCRCRHRRFRRPRTRTGGGSTHDAERPTRPDHPGDSRPAHAASRPTTSPATVATVDVMRRGLGTAGACRWCLAARGRHSRRR